MSDETEQSAKEERLKAAWDRWFEIDFSWDGLKTPAKIRGPWDDEGAEPSFDPKETDGVETLQAYWLKNPETGEVRNEQQLIDADELIKFEGQKTYHIAHLPIAYADGTLTIKSTNREVISKKLEAIIQARLRAASQFSDVSNADTPAPFIIRARLTGVVLLDCNLSKKSFDAKLNAIFDEAILLGRVHFGDATFSDYASFDNTTFSQHTRFNNTTFSDYTSFVNTTFSDRTNFYKTTFSGNASFDKSTFYGSANFNNTTFSGNASFDKSTFYSNANFNNTTFSDYVSFDTTSFFKNTYFHSNSFSGNASFDNAVFSSYTTFYSTTFSRLVSFDNTTFSDRIFFASANFMGLASFEASAFKKKLSFAAARFDNQVSFEKIEWPTDFKDYHRIFDGTTFNQLVDFTGSGFKNFAAFDGARFEGGIRLDRTSDSLATSQFFCELDPLIGYEGLNSTSDGTKARKTKAAMQRKKKLTDANIKKEREDFIEQLEAGCRVLKLEMEKAADKNREQLLYRFELMARREQDNTSGTEKLFSRAYELFSDYANSTARPLGWLLLTLALSGLGAYAPDGWLGLLSATPANVIIKTDKLPLIGGLIEPIGLGWPDLLHARFNWDSLWSAMSFSLGNTVHPLSVLSSENLPSGSVAYRLLTQYGEGYGFLTRAFASLQSILSIVLVFLFALAVRRRFQIN